MLSDVNETPSKPRWSEAQQKFLNLLQDENNRQLSKLALCNKAGYAFAGAWYTAVKNPEFREAVKALYEEGEHQKLAASSLVSTPPHPWSKAQQKFLDLLQDENNRQLSRLALCQKAGFSNVGHWYRSIEDPQFRQALKDLGIEVERCKLNPEVEEKRQEPQLSRVQQKLLAALQVAENRQLDVIEICRKAGVGSKTSWYRALENPAFRSAVEALGVVIERTGIYAKPKETTAAPEWGRVHQTFLDLLQVQENRKLTITDLCQKAGFHSTYWYRALKHPQFKDKVESLGIEIERHELSSRGQTKAQRKILEVLQDEANRQLPIVEICRRAGYLDDFWYKSLKSDSFVTGLESLGVEVRRREYNENGWTEVQQNLLDALQDPTNHALPITEICRRAGYPNCTYWFRALRNSRFVAAIEAIGMKIWWNGRNADGFTRAQQRFLDFLKENPVITAGELCRQLGYSSTASWTEVIRDEHFITTLEALGIEVERIPRRDDGWTWGHKRLLEVLQAEENRDIPVTQLCQRAGYSIRTWYRALERPEVLAALKELQVRIRRCGPDEEGWTWAQQRLLTVLEDEDNRNLSIIDLCEKAGYSDLSRWYESLANEQFVEILQGWGVPIARQKPPFEPHTNVKPTMSLEEELNQDVWDLRRIKPDYRKHRHPSQYIVDFTWIENPKLRQQVKQYLRQLLPKWGAGTFSPQFARLKSVLIHLPASVDLETINYTHIGEIVPQVLFQQTDTWAKESLQATKSMLNYMACSKSWKGPRPPKDLITKDDIPSAETPLPRPIPPQVLDQLDPLLEQAIQEITSGGKSPILEPIFWDAILILRRTGMRFADLAHLKTPGAHNQGGCLGQDGDGDWWIHIDPDMTKIGREHQIPTIPEDGIVDAILRQSERVKAAPDHFGESYLFRTQDGVLAYGAMCKALNKLSHYLTYVGQPYAISPHQFRHTIATDMINNGQDIIVVRDFLGHTSFTMTLRYIKVYRESLQSKYRSYRDCTREQNIFTPLPSELFASSIVPFESGEIVSGWVEGYEGKLYRFDLQSGLGVCEQPPKLQLPCLISGQCSTTCIKLRAGKQHLPAWENWLRSLKVTMELLKDCPGYEWSYQQQEQELKQAEKVVATVQREGFWDGRIHNAERR